MRSDLRSFAPHSIRCRKRDVGANDTASDAYAQKIPLLTVVPDNRLPVLFGRLARTEIGFVVDVHAASDPISLRCHVTKKIVNLLRPPLSRDSAISAKLHHFGRQLFPDRDPKLLFQNRASGMRLTMKFGFPSGLFFPSKKFTFSCRVLLYVQPVTFHPSIDRSLSF